jgi:hypothetical protein
VQAWVFAAGGPLSPLEIGNHAPASNGAYGGAKELMCFRFQDRCQQRPSRTGQKRHLPNPANKRNVNAGGKLKQIERKDYDTGLQ